MTRNLDADFKAALEAEEVRPFYAAQLDLDQGPLRLWTGYGDITIDGNTFTGAGNLLGFSGFEEVNDLSAKSISITLSGLDQTVLSLALTEPIANRKVRVFFGAEASDGTRHAIEIFTGRANTIPFEDDGETGRVELSVDSKLVRLNEASNRRYTQGSHQARHPNDTFFSFVADLQDKEIAWGRKSS
jgi:hypothetical protein